MNCNCYVGKLRDGKYKCRIFDAVITVCKEATDPMIYILITSY
jgi:hypothetical protein